jgi:hypothetical protein
LPGFFLDAFWPAPSADKTALSGFFLQDAQRRPDAAYSGKPIQLSQASAQNPLHAETNSADEISPYNPN